MSTYYTYWQNALTGQFGAVHENDPQSGYYRMRCGKGGPWVPVAIWINDEVKDSSDLPVSQLFCLVDGKERNAYDVWTWVCRYPITYETYVAVAEEGKPWPDEVPEVKAVSPVYTSGDALPSFGHNSGSLDQASVFREEIEALSSLALSWLDELGGINAQSEADRAANYADRFTSLETRAEEARTIEKRPSLEEGRQIDARWKPVVSKAQEAKVKLKKALEPYLVGERQRRIEVAKASFEGSDTVFDPSVIDPPRAGTNGRRMGLRSKYAVKITEPSALVDHYRTDLRLWADKSVKEAIAKLAEADLTAGAEIQGAMLMEEFSVV